MARKANTHTPIIIATIKGEKIYCTCDKRDCKKFFHPSPCPCRGHDAKR